MEPRRGFQMQIVEIVEITPANQEALEEAFLAWWSKNDHALSLGGTGDVVGLLLTLKAAMGEITDAEIRAGVTVLMQYIEMEGCDAIIWNPRSGLRGIIQEVLHAARWYAPETAALGTKRENRD